MSAVDSVVSAVDSVVLVFVVLVFFIGGMMVEPVRNELMKKG